MTHGTTRITLLLLLLFFFSTTVRSYRSRPLSKYVNVMLIMTCCERITRSLDKYVGIAVYLILDSEISLCEINVE
jgi:hypothetical protein